MIDDRLPDKHFGRQVKFKAKPVPSHVKQERFLSMLEAREERKAAARQKARQKLDAINDDFQKSLGRVAGSMSTAMQPFVGTIEDNIMCMYIHLTSCIVSCHAGSPPALFPRQHSCNGIAVAGLSSHADAKAESPRSVHPFVVAAAKAVGLHDAVIQLPKKYKTVIQERGLGRGHHELDNAELHLLALARKNFQVRSKHAALRHTDTMWNKHSGVKKKMGAVPDFDALHARWETQLSMARAEMKQRIPPAKVGIVSSSSTAS